MLYNNTIVVQYQLVQSCLKLRVHNNNNNKRRKLKCRRAHHSKTNHGPVSKMPSSLTTDNLPVHEPPAADSEPGPSYWQEANQLLGLSWEFHWAGFGFLLGVLAVHSAFVLAQIQARKGFGRRPFFLGVKILLAILGTTRALFLFVDPYSSGENSVEIPRWLLRLLYGIAFPSLTSSF